MNKIVYGTHTFTDHEIESGNLHLVTNLISAQLEANTLTVVVRSNDTPLTNFERNAKLTLFTDEKQTGIFYVQSINRVGSNKYQIDATSAVGLLIEGQHMGGIYTGQTAQDVIADICGTVPFIVKTNLVATKLYGWLPIASPRDNLSQVLFAIGAALKTDLDGVLRIAGLWDGVSSVTPQNRMYENGKVEYGAKVTQIILTEHQYSEGQEEKKLFEGTAQEGDAITFNAPMHSLSATGISILSSGANWAKISAGSGTLTGKEYIHNTRLITRDVQTANEPNVKTVDKATLISLVNSAATADRLVSFYKCSETINAPVVYHGEDTGNVISTYHPFDGESVNACLQSADVTLSNTLKAQEKSLVGFLPVKISDIEILDKQVIFTKSGSWIVPDGSTKISVVVIGPGQNGQDGKKGEDGENGTGATAPKGATKDSQYFGTYGNGGKGGEPGKAGEGGKIFYINLDVVGNEELSVDINATETTFSILNVTYSSESGSSNPNGYTDITTGITYAKRGLNGVRGADGGHGGGYKIEPENGKSVNQWDGGRGGKQGYYMESEYNIGKWGGGGGGAAYGNNGDNAYPQHVTVGTYPYGGNGARPYYHMPSREPGSGGNGGSGGGGGGGGGAGQIDVKSTLSDSVTVNGGKGGSGGSGLGGLAGVMGCVIIYYGNASRIKSGRFVDKNGKQILDKLSRRFIV